MLIIFVLLSVRSVSKLQKWNGLKRDILCSCDFHKMLRIIIQQSNVLTAHDGVNEIGACAHQLHLHLSVFFHTYIWEECAEKIACVYFKAFKKDHQSISAILISL